jgi:TonB-linked SusC/RagA family outer membrane protein
MTIAALTQLTRRPLFGLGLLIISAGTLAAQGSVSGRLTDKANGSALIGARVVVVGTSLTTATNAEGRYRIQNVPVGTVQIRASQIGYASAALSVAVGAGATATADFTLVLTPYSLDEVVVTATGDQAKREIGNAVSTVEVADLVRTTPVANMNDLLVAKAPGVQVLPGNLTGTGARVRIRGSSSLSLSNNPIYVVDGIRVASAVNSAAIGIGGSNPSRVNDLNPEDIESIDIVRGPSAATLYGTDAANGVIVIKTKKGRAGRPVWNAYLEQGAIKDLNTYPTNYRAWTAASTASNTTQCKLSQVIARSCVRDSVSSFNPWADKVSSPLSTGHRQQYGVQVSGGTDLIRYFVAGEWEDELGVLKMPQAFAERLLASRDIAKVPFSQLHPNGLRKTSVRANLSASLSEKIDVQLNSGFVTSTQQLPQTDNNTVGLGSNLYGGPGFKNNIVSPATGVSRNNLGYRLYTPDEFFSDVTRQDINRTTSAGTLNYRPTHWLAARLVGGLDFVSREDANLCARGECTYFGTHKLGFAENARTTIFNYTLNTDATATYRMGEHVGAKSTVGIQYGKEKQAQNDVFASDLAAGGTTVNAGAIPSLAEATSISATAGYFAEQSFSYKDRLYLTGAVRSDRNSAFGTQFQRVYYPKASVSYVLSDESFFPKSSVLTSLRLRGAYGASGRQPGSNDALAFYSPVIASVDATDTPGIVFASLLNPGLKPERSGEIELGFDASFARSRVNIEFTYYKKSSKDALIARLIAPSAGLAASRLENIGKTLNEGIEGTINATILDSKQLGWELTLSGSYNKNKIVSLSGNPLSPGVTNWSRENYPILGWWTRPYTYSDSNGDGLIALTEITVGDTAVYQGPVLPTGEFTAYNTLDLFGRKLRVQALVDAKVGGYTEFDTERIRCQSRNNCRGDIDPTASLSEQAASVAARQHASGTQYGYISKSDFIRLRELSLTWTFPDRWARWFSASRISATASGRNLGTLTKYPGIDPETGYFATNGAGLTNDFQTAPPPSYFTFRLNVAF